MQFRKKYLHFVRGALAGAVVLGLSACSAVKMHSSPEQQVTERSEAFWKARMSGDVAKAYGFTTPGYRAVNDLDAYRLNYGAIPGLQGGEIVKVQCELERCEVTKAFTTSAAMMPGARIPLGVTEVWVYQDGGWWLHIRN